MPSAEEVYLRHERTIPAMVARDLARGHRSQRSAIEDEARSMMGLVLLSGWETILAGPESPGTRLHHRVRWDMLTERSRGRDPLADQHRERIARKCREDQSSTWIERLLSEVSAEAGALIRAVLEAPEELTRLGRSERGRTRLRRYLRRELGWSKDRLNRSWSEVREQFL